MYGKHPEPESHYRLENPSKGTKFWFSEQIKLYKNKNNTQNWALRLFFALNLAPMFFKGEIKMLKVTSITTYF